MDMVSTLKGSYFEEIFPKGWDIERISACVSNPPERFDEAQPFWNEAFRPVLCDSPEEFGAYMGHEMAVEIKKARDEDRELIMILPVGPMGMYKWAVYFLTEWNVSCAHVHTFNMDEWSDENGNTLSPEDPAAFQKAMIGAFFRPLGALTVPETQRNFATRANLPTYAGKIDVLRARGARQVLVYGIGRVCHIAFWEPHFALEVDTDEEWMKSTHRLGARLHPLTIEQNAVTSFRSAWPLIPCYANTIGPKLLFSSDYAIGGADGVFSRGMQWQGMSFWMTLRYGPTRFVTSSYIPTLPGKLFFLRELAGPLVADTN